MLLGIAQSLPCQEKQAISEENSEETQKLPIKERKGYTRQE